MTGNRSFDRERDLNRPGRQGRGTRDVVRIPARPRRWRRILAPKVPNPGPTAAVSGGAPSTAGERGTVQASRARNDKAVRDPRVRNDEALRDPRVRNEAVPGPRVRNDGAIRGPRVRNRRAVQSSRAPVRISGAPGQGDPPPSTCRTVIPRGPLVSTTWTGRE